VKAHKRTKTTTKSRKSSFKSPAKPNRRRLPKSARVVVVGARTARPRPSQAKAGEDFYKVKNGRINQSVVA